MKTRRRRVAETSGSDSPRVSVFMLAYNHERFIRQAIDSVLMQEVDFDVELVIGEDCSPDRTRSIVEEYAARHPGVVRPLLHERNLGARKNSVATRAACRGVYVAALEADDFWTDPGKLQRQVDLLETRADAVLCAHRVRYLDDDGAEGRDGGVSPPECAEGGIEELGERNYLPTCSVVVRRQALQPLPAWAETLTQGDWPTWMLAVLGGGRILFLDEVMAVYRRHPGGIWSRLTLREGYQRIAEAARRMAVHLRGQLPPGGRRGLARGLAGLAADLRVQGALRESFRTLWRAFLCHPGAAWSRLRDQLVRSLRRRLGRRPSPPGEGGGL